MTKETDFSKCNLKSNDLNELYSWKKRLDEHINDLSKKQLKLLHLRNLDRIYDKLHYKWSIKHLVPLYIIFGVLIAMSVISGIVVSNLKPINPWFIYSNIAFICVLVIGLLILNNIQTYHPTKISFRREHFDRLTAINTTIISYMYMRKCVYDRLCMLAYDHYYTNAYNTLKGIAETKDCSIEDLYNKYNYNKTDDTLYEEMLEKIKGNKDVFGLYNESLKS